MEEIVGEEVGCPHGVRLVVRSHFLLCFCSHLTLISPFPHDLCLTNPQAVFARVGSCPSHVKALQL